MPCERAIFDECIGVGKTSGPRSRGRADGGGARSERRQLHRVRLFSRHGRSEPEAIPESSVRGRRCERSVTVRRNRSMSFSSPSTVRPALSTRTTASLPRRGAPRAEAGRTAIFSLHNAGSLFFRPQRSWRSVLGALRRSLPRFVERGRSRGFWNGLDYHDAQTHGGMRILLARRARVVAEVAKHRFSVSGFSGMTIRTPIFRLRHAGTTTFAGKSERRPSAWLALHLLHDVVLPQRTDTIQLQSRARVAALAPNSCRRFPSSTSCATRSKSS